MSNEAADNGLPKEVVKLGKPKVAKKGKDRPFMIKTAPPTKAARATIIQRTTLKTKVKELEAKQKRKGSKLMLTPSTTTATELSDTITVLKNISSNTLPFGFIPPHGKELAPGDVIEVDGDLIAQLTNGGRISHRKLDALQNAITLKILRYHVRHRLIQYYAVDAGAIITAGDLVWLNTDDVKAASDFVWDTNLATTQAEFVNLFVGVALDDHPAGTGVVNFPVDISPMSIYEYACTSEAHENGDTMGPAKAAGNALLNQTLAKAVAASACARCVKRDASADTRTIVRLQSAFAGNNAAGAQ